MGYRKKVVFQNLRNSFPEKSEKEIKLIGKLFYRYLCDLILETLKTISMNKKEMNKRCIIKNISLLKKLYAEKKNIILVMGHYGNWEWGGAAFSLQTDYSLFVIYRPLSNKYFDHLLYKMRTAFGTQLIEMNHTFKEMIRNKQNTNATAFIADQTPPPDHAHWTTFLNQKTPVFKGTELIAKKLNYPIVFINIKRMKRGYYEVYPEMLVENPALTGEGEITELHTKKLEKEIINQPELWLWSHRRWKHKKN